ncbi:MAG TPA: hypothetical protein VHU92_21730 [Streptosporangiaceae bacterium]|nr:hypothetical protein [Streptosporangiaceae bacterium]
MIRRISVSTGRLSTAAGSGYGGYGRTTPDGTPAARAALGPSCGVTTDHHGNLIYTDMYGDRVDVAAAATATFYGQHMTKGDVYSIGGDGSFGYSGDGGPAVDAGLDTPAGVAVDAAGNVVVDDSANNVLRIIAATSGTFYGRAMTAGEIYTLAGGGSELGNGIPATSAALELTDPGGEYPGVQPWSVVAGDSAGNIVLVQGGGNGGEGAAQVIAGRTGTFYGRKMTAGYIYVVGGGGTKLGDGIPATKAAFAMPAGVALDHAGNILVTDPYPGVQRVFVIAKSTGTFYGRKMKAGYMYILAGNGKDGFAGDGGPARDAEFSGPEGLAVDSAGNVVIADGVGGAYNGGDNHRLRVVAARAGTFYGQKMKAGDIYTISGPRGLTYFGDGGPAARALLGLGEIYGAPPADTGVAGTRSGSTIFADQHNNRVRMVPATTGTFFGQRMRAGDIYTIAGTGQYAYSGDDGLATRAAISHPDGLTLDSAGNVLVADAYNNRVRIIAARTGRFYGRAMKTGHIYTLAGNGKLGTSGDGGLATSAYLDPYGVAVDSAGNVLIADPNNLPGQFNSLIRVVAARTGTYYGVAMKAGDIYTVAGAGHAGLGDGGPAARARFNNPTGVAVTPSGAILVLDFNRVRRISQ